MIKLALVCVHCTIEYTSPSVECVVDKTIVCGAGEGSAAYSELQEEELLFQEFFSNCYLTMCF